MSFELRPELLKLALAGPARFSPYGAELLKDDWSGGQGVPQTNLPSAAPSPSLPGAPPPRTPPAAVQGVAPGPPLAKPEPGGRVNVKLQPFLGGNQSFSTLSRLDTGALRGIAMKRGLDPSRLESEFSASSGMKSPEDINRFWNTMNVESGFRDVTGDKGTSVGIGQIHMPAHPEFKGTNLHDPYTNVRAAGDIVKRQGWKAYLTTQKRLGYM